MIFATFNPAEFSWQFWPHGIFEFYVVCTSSFMRFFIDNVVVNAIILATSYSKINYLGLSGGQYLVYMPAAYFEIHKKLYVISRSNVYKTPT
jgi:hypothetical protein